MMNPYLIASYPRSGSTWMRFILCNLLYPDVEHTFDTVNRYIPPIDHEPGMRQAIQNPLFYKTHGLHFSKRIIFVHRHVGDVLISEWWYKKKFHNEERTLFRYIEDTNYGEGWRSYVNHYFPCDCMVTYCDIGNARRYQEFFPAVPVARIAIAISLSSFSQMQKVEKLGFGIYPVGNPKIPFVREGQSGNWKTWELGFQEKLIDKNFCQLKMLGYL